MHQNQKGYRKNVRALKAYLLDIEQALRKEDFDNRDLLSTVERIIRECEQELARLNHAEGGRVM